MAREEPHRPAPLEELRALLARHARPGVTTLAENVLVSRADQPGPPLPATSGTLLALIAQGAKSIAVGDRVLHYRAGQYLVASVDLPVTGQYTEASPERPALGFGLVLDPAAIAGLLLQSGPGDLPRGGPAPSALVVSDAPAPF